MTASQYLFILKDHNSISLSKSDDTERRLIHRHAQIDAIRRRRSGRGSSSSLGPVFVAVDPGKENQLHRQSGPPASHRSSDVALPVSLPKGQARCCCVPAASESGPQFDTCPIHSIDRMPTTAEHVIDPFAAIAVKVDNQLSHTLLQYFIRVSHPRTWHSEARSLAKNVYTFQSDALTLVRDSLHNEVHFYCMLASMASQLSHFEHASQYERSTTLLTQKAIRAIRSHIENSAKVDQRFLFDVHQMAVTEFYRYEVESALVHLQAVKSIIIQLGGWRNVDTSLREWIVIGDGYVAAELLQKPVFPASSIDPGRTSEYPRIRDGLFSAGASFRQPRFEGILPVALREILNDLTACIPFVEEHFGRTEAARDSSSMATLHWLLLRVTAIRHRLLEINVTNDIAEAIRIALISWLFLVTTITGRRRTAKVLASKLQQLLLRMDHDAWDNHEDALLWVLLLGAMTATGNVQEWYLEQVAEATSHLQDLDHAGSIESTLARLSGNFFYLDGVQKWMLQEVAEQLRERKGGADAGHIRTLINDEPATSG